MNPRAIAVNDYINVSFVDNSKTSDLLVTAVSASVVNQQNSYAVTAGGVVYTVTASNTVIRERSANTNGKFYWVLGA